MSAIEEARAALAALEEKNQRDLRGRGFNPAIESALQGATFGFSDEIQAGLGAGADVVGGALTGNPVSFGQRYGARQQAMQDAITAHAQEYPLASTIGNVAGGLLMAKPVTQAAGQLPGAAALSQVPNIAKLPAAGVASGTIAGGASAPQGERLGGAALGGLLGGAFGLGTAGVVGGVNALKGPATKAMRKVGEAIGRDDRTPAQIGARLRTLGPEATIADAGGENTLGLSRAAQSVPGKAKNQIKRALMRRDRGQAERLVQPIERTLGNNKTFVDTFDDLADLRTELAAPLYDKAYARPVRITPKLRELMERPSIQQGISRARDIADDSGESFPDALEDAGVREWDMIKRGIDDVLYGPKGDSPRHVEPLSGKIVTEQGRAIAKARGEMVQELDRQVPVYGEARAAWAGPSQSQDAMESGAAFLRGDIDRTVKELRKLSESDKAFFRLGAAQTLRNKIEMKGFTHDSSKLFDNPAMQRKLRAVFPNVRSYREFISTLLKESRFSTTKNTTLGGSPTMRIAAEQSDAARDTAFGLAADVATGNTTGALGNLARRAASVASKLKMSPQQSAELNRILFTKSAAEQANILAQLESPAALRATFGPAAAVGGGNLLGIGINQR